jgi:crotonobetainyl-CoA:carnitine CoA-transferase CaiB-like acyl-CoA transferase
MSGHIPSRIGSLHPNIAPYGETFTCADGKQIVLAIGSNRQFKTLCEILGDADLPDQSEFEDNSGRVKNRNLLGQKLERLFARFPSGMLMEQFIASDVPAGAIRSMDEVMQNSTAQQMILTETIEGVQTKRMQSAAFTLEDL